jgi:stage II sporulation protein D
MKANVRGGRAGLAIGVLWVVLWTALGSGLARADSGCGETVRVLLQRGDAQLKLETGGRTHRFAVAGKGLRVDGRLIDGPWRSETSRLSLVGRMRVRGAIEVHRARGGLAVINEVALEDYVAGVVAGEVPSGWHAEALRAQAVASRTYALHQRRVQRARPYHVEATTTDQVYAGADIRESYRDAVQSTRCQVLTSDGAPILAAFHSASGGRTASSVEVWGRPLDYLVSREVTGEADSPDTYWRAAISRTTLSRALSAAGHGIGEVTEAEVQARSDSGRVSRIRFAGERGEVRITGRQLRSALGENTLRSTLFELVPRSRGFLFVGSGRGHGVGMSQWGALGLARDGKTYDVILERFYPGAALVHWSGGRAIGRVRPAGPGRAAGSTRSKREERRVAIRSEESR